MRSCIGVLDEKELWFNNIEEDEIEEQDEEET